MREIVYKSIVCNNGTEPQNTAQNTDNIPINNFNKLFKQKSEKNDIFAC